MEAMEKSFRGPLIEGRVFSPLSEGTVAEKNTVPPTNSNARWKRNHVLAVAAGLFACLSAPAYGGAPADKKPVPKKTIAAASAEAAPPKRVGRLFKIVLPITGRTTERLRQPVLKAIEQAEAEQAHPVLIFEFAVPKGQSYFGRGSKIGNAYDLADFLSGGTLNAATTVAYVPQTVQGHAVLDVLACDVILMAPEAELGPAGVDEEHITDSIRTNYREIASRRKRVPAEVALKLVDASRELLEVETDIGTEYTTPDGLAELAKRRTIGAKTVVLAAGQPGRFSGSEARRKGFISALAADRVEVARAVEVAPEMVKEDVALEGVFHAVRVDVKGPIRSDSVTKIQGMIQDAITRQNADFICLRIESAGGSPADSIRLASYLLDLDSGKVLVVAYIPKEARCDSALIALACDQIVMHPRAVLGGEGDAVLSQEDIKQIRTVIRDEIAARKTRSWSLPAAMFDPKLSVSQYTHKGQSGFFSAEELAAQAQPDQWTAGETVTKPEKVFVATGNDAVVYRLASHVVDDFAQFKELYGLESDPSLLEPRWSDLLVDALASPGAAVLLLILGGVALYVELHTPGLGIAAFVALVCFALFFWSRFLGGTAGWLQVILFVAGVSCLALELFVLPGFGVFGLGGGAMILASLVLASQTFLLPRNTYQAAEFQNSLLIVASAMVGMLVVIATINRWLPRAPILSQMVLQPPSEEEAAAISESESLTHFENLVGAVGHATTPLVPAGKALFGDQLLDVLTDGDFVSPGAKVVVAAVHGNRIVVREAKA
jgi:membrane-bound ClpP family serine protease